MTEDQKAAAIAVIKEAEELGRDTYFYYRHGERIAPCCPLGHLAWLVLPKNKNAHYGTIPELVRRHYGLTERMRGALMDINDLAEPANRKIAVLQYLRSLPTEEAS